LHRCHAHFHGEIIGAHKRVVAVVFISIAAGEAVINESLFTFS
jgi:hypothetical protein